MSLFLPMYNFFKRNIILIIILAGAFIVRWYGIYFDYPGTGYIWDEIYNISHLLTILDNKTIFLEWPPSPYPFFLPILYLPVLALRIIYLALINHLTTVAAIKNYFILDGMGKLYIISRWYSVFFGTATVYLVYKIYSYIFKKRISSYYAALVYSVSLLPVFLSHWGKVHSGMVFFLMLSLYYCLRYEAHKKNKYLLWSVISSALSISIHYIGISSMIFPIYLIIKNRKTISSRIIVGSLALFASICSFFYLINYNGVIRIIVDMKRYYESNGYTSVLPIGIFERFYYVFRDYFYLDPVFLALFIIMLIVLFRNYLKNNYTKYVLVGLFFNYLLMISIIAAPQMSRWLLIFATLAVPLGAGSFIEYLSEKNFKPHFLAFISIMLLLPSLYLTVHWLSLLNHNTYMEVKEWLENDIRHSAVVYTFDPLVYTAPSYETAWYEINKNYNLVSKKFDYIVQNKDSFEGKGVMLLNDKRNNRYKELGGEDTEYVIVCDSSTVHEIEKYHKISLILSFNPIGNNGKKDNIKGDALNSPVDYISIISLDKSGPPLEIYKVLQ